MNVADAHLTLLKRYAALRDGLEAFLHDMQSEKDGVTRCYLCELVAPDHADGSGGEAVCPIPRLTALLRETE